MRGLSLAAFLALASLAPGVALADCVHSAFEQDLDDLIDQAEGEYPQMGDGRFGELTDQLLAELPCLDEPVSPQFAARVHRVLGLRSRVVDRDDDTARMAFASSRAIDPNYSWPEDVVASRDPERAMYVAVPPGMIVRETAPVPKGGHVFFDGAETLERPANAPTLFQRFDGEMRIVETRWLTPTDEIPAYPFVREEAPVVEKDKPPALRVLATGASAAMVGAGAALIGAGSWDRGNICVAVGAEECTLAAKERVVTGAILLGVGVGGVAGSQFLFGATPRGVGMRWAGTW